MKQRKCKNCKKFRQYYYKGSTYLMPSDFGKCTKESGNPVATNAICEAYEERNDGKTTLLRQQNILETLPRLIGEINNLLLILLSDKQE